MILQTMTPEEKVRQVSKIELDIRYAARSWVEHNLRLLKKRQSYPYTHTIKREFKGMGVWYILITFNEKPKFSKGVGFCCNAYQKYFVSKGTKAENIGAGIYFIGGSSPRKAFRSSHVTLCELTPHFFNRYRERYLRLSAHPNMTFQEMFMNVFEDIAIGISPNTEMFEAAGIDGSVLELMTTPHYPGYDNLLLFIRHGLCLGFRSRHDDYQCYLTYVGPEEFFPGQHHLHQLSKNVLDLYDMMSSLDPSRRATHSPSGYSPQLITGKMCRHLRLSNVKVSAYDYP